jgi:hypothetical protein
MTENGWRITRWRKARPHGRLLRAAYGLVNTCAPRCGVLPHMYHTVPLIELHQLHLLELQVS